MSMLDHLRQALPDSVPFVMAASSTINRDQRLDTKRVMEQVITGVVVALIVGAGGYFLALPALTKELQTVQSQLQQMRIEAKEDRLNAQNSIQRLTEKLHSVELEFARKVKDSR